MSFFEMDGADSAAVETAIKDSLKRRNIPLDRDHETLARCTPDRFLEDYFSRRGVRLRIFLNNLPPWVYKFCKALPFYDVIRNRLLLTARKSK